MRIRMYCARFLRVRLARVTDDPVTSQIATSFYLQTLCASSAATVCLPTAARPRARHTACCEPFTSAPHQSTLCRDEYTVSHLRPQVPGQTTCEQPASDSQLIRTRSAHTDSSFPFVPVSYCFYRAAV